MKTLISRIIQESIDVKSTLMEDSALLNTVQDIAYEIVKCIKNGNKIVLCGNGGSASDAMHFAGEIVGRFQKERSAWPAITLNSDIATMTAIANDYGYDEVFARQAEGHIEKGDIFIGISTSGNSENVFRAACVAKKKGAVTAGLLGKAGGKIKDILDFPVVVPSNTTARIQECHILLIHIICEIVETELS